MSTIESKYVGDMSVGDVSRLYLHRENVWSGKCPRLEYEYEEDGQG